MDNRELFNRDKLIQQLHDIHSEQPIQGVHKVQPSTVYGAERAELEKAAEVGRAASEQIARATAASEPGRTAILKGLQAGKDIYTLFVAACDTISAVTGDTVFSTQAREIIRDVYGKALGEKSPLRAELDAVEQRAERIRRSMEQEDIDARARENMGRALRAHQREAAQLREKINA